MYEKEIQIRIKRAPYRELYQLLWFFKNSFICIGCKTIDEVEKWRLCIVKCVITRVGMFFEDIIVDCSFTFKIVRKEGIRDNNRELFSGAR